MLTSGGGGSPAPRAPGILWLVIVAAFVAQLLAGLARGPGYVDEGYSFYTSLATTFLDGHGLCYAPGEWCTSRMPLYTLIIAPFVYSNSAYPGLIVLQSLIGASIVWLTYRIGESLFNARVGLGAAVLAGLNPYAVIHNASFQDTVVVNALMAWMVLCLVRSTAERIGPLVLAGVVLALAVLTNARVALLVPLVAAWVAWASPAGLRVRRTACLRVRRTACFVLPLTVMLGGWIARNAAIDGAAVLTSEAGRNLWVANNSATMSVYPNRSTDDVAAVAGERLTEVEQASIAVTDPIERDRAYAALAWHYLAGHPGRTVAAALFKVVIAFSGWLSPARGWLTQLAFAVLFLPVTAAALAMIWRSRGAGAPHVLVGLIVIAFAATTAIYWAHTSHQSYLHPLFFIYACAALDARRLLPRWRPRST